MKKLLSFSFLLFILSGMGCGTISDSGGHGYYVWINDSDHEITLSLMTSSSLGLENENIKPGGLLEIVNNGGIGRPSSPFLLFEEVSVSFDDGVCQITYGNPRTPIEYRLPSTNYENLYNPTIDVNYVEEKLGKYEYQWTYTFTNADYEAAKAMSEAATE